MCGIVGIRCAATAVDGVSAIDVVRRMAETLRHRGPDDAGAWLAPDGRVALAHRRLSIVDLSPLGRNPMLRDGGRLAITFNGEIYNFRELRRELEHLGHRFASSTDTEVILAAYDQWGLDAVQRFAGMFAFGLWDEPRKRLWLVRDRLGKKPLYYSDYGGILRFGSELKALLADDRLPRVVDITAVRLFLKYGYIPAPLTIFQGIRKLEPGHALTSTPQGTTLARYWDPLPFARANRTWTTEDAEAELERHLSTAVEQRRIADVPLGAFLSGGIDSSLVVALMQEQSASRVRTFSIRFENPAFNEADHAAAVAAHLGTDHSEQLCDERTLLDVVDRLPDMFDEPFGDSSAIPTYVVSAMARQQVTVALSGDGGDELFFGYPRYRHFVDSRWVLALPRPARELGAFVAARMGGRRQQRVADVLRAEEGDAYEAFISWCTPRQIAACTGHPSPRAPLYQDMLDSTADCRPDLRCQLFDLVSYLPDDILTKVDRASMAVGLETRSPLLDHRVVEFALSLPAVLKSQGGQTKWLLRWLLYKRVPRSLLERPKMGFGVPLRDWFLGPLRERMDDYSRSDAWESMGIEPDPLRRMWREFSRGRYHRPDVVWQAFTLAAWSARFRPSSGTAASRTDRASRTSPTHRRRASESCASAYA